MNDETSQRRLVINIAPVSFTTLADLADLVEEAGYHGSYNQAAFILFESFVREQINSLDKRIESADLYQLSEPYYLEPYFPNHQELFMRAIDILEKFNMYMLTCIQEKDPLSPSYAYVFDAVTSRYLVYHTFT